MNTEIITSLIGAAGTIVVAVIGALAAKPVSDSARTNLQPPATWLKRNLPLVIGVTGLAISVVILAAGYLIGEQQKVHEDEVNRKIAVIKETSSYQTLVNSGLDAKKDYVIPEMLMLVTLDKSEDGKAIDSSRRMIYGLQVLNPINKSHPDFREEYHSNYEVDHVPGIDPENDTENSPGMKAWDVLFDSVPGTRRLVMTEAHVRMPMTLAGNHSVHMFQGLGPNQDGFCYPNEDGDVIGELVIVVESHTMRLSLPSGGANDAMLQHDNQMIRADSNAFSVVKGNDIHQLVVARFTNVGNKDVVGLKVQWNPQK